MGDAFAVILENRLRYTTTYPVPVEDVIASLQGMDSLVKRNLPKAIRTLTGAKVKSAELLVSGIEDGSLIENVAIVLGFSSEEDLNKYLQSVRSKYITKDAEGNTVIKAQAIAPLLTAIALVGLGYYIGNSSGASTPSTPPLIQGDGNVVVTIGAEAYKTDPQNFVRAVEAAVTSRNAANTAKAGAQYFAPASGETGAGLQFAPKDSEPVDMITPQTIAKLPRTIEKTNNSEDASYKNVEIKLRASDADSESRGWAGTIEEISDKRVRVIFNNPSDVGKATYRPSIKADVIVTYSDAAHIKPILYIVEKVH